MKLIQDISKQAKLKIINNKFNIGAHESVNTGYACATGKYVTHLDVDDKLPIYAIETRVRLLETNGCDFVITAEEVNFQGLKTIVKPCNDLNEVSSFLMGHKNMQGINTHAYLVKRKKLLLHGGRPQLANRHHSDYAFVLKMIVETNWVASNDVTYVYRRSKGVLSKNIKHNKWLSSLSAIESEYALLINSINKLS